MALVKIENHHALLRDGTTNAVINSNKTEYENYISNYNRLKKEKEQIDILQNQVTSLSSDVEEIKSLLKLLVKEKIDGN
jgi:hypothetical protein